VQLDVILPHLVAAGLIILISFPVHEFAHAWTAWRLGDSTARLFGRLTLNPIVHFDPLGGILLILSSLVGFGIGWAKPTPVNPNNLRGGRWSEAMVAAAGPLSNLVLAAIGAVPFRAALAAYDNGTAVPVELLDVLYDFVLINVALLLFNFVPVPPLDGSKVLYGLLTPRQQWQWRPVLEQYGILLLIAVAFLPLLPGNQTLFQAVFVRIGGPLIELLTGIPPF
jgi:Zn-dependent protease